MICKDCLGDMFCSKQDKKKRVDKYCADADEVCNYFKDKSRFVELPCKVGDITISKNKNEQIELTSKYFDFRV